MCAATLAAAACGGGQPDRLTKQEYIAEFKAIGEELEKGTFASVLDPDIDSSNFKAVAEYADEAADAFDELADRADKLVPPEEIESSHDKLVDGLHQFAGFFHDLADKIRTRPAVELQDLVDQLGGEFDPSKVAGASEIQEAITELQAKGYGVVDKPKPAGPRPAIAPAVKAAGKKVFLSSGCGACHTLADAGASGSVGPNLDQTRPVFATVVERVTNGANIMPSFKTMLSTTQIEDVSHYVEAVAG